jgi:hypothetical protein
MKALGDWKERRKLALEAANARKAPGSDTAKASGCLCPAVDNGRGVGYMGSSYHVIVVGCPLHDGNALKMQTGESS